MKIDGLDLLIKPTLECNARCIYCHSMKPAKKMTLDVLDTLFKKAADYGKRKGLSTISVNWHGGEPMLMGAGFYRDALEIQDKYFTRDQVLHGMQSNACLYKGEVREALKELMNEKTMGASFDPFHPTRGLIKGGDSFPDALEGSLAMMQDGFSVDMIYVIHKKSLDVVREVYHFFKNMRVQGVLFHPLEEYPGKEYRLEPDDLAVFLRRLWEVWEEDDYELDISPLSEWRAFLKDREPIDSCDFGLPSGSSLHVTVSPEGNLYPCPRFQDRDQCCIGNIRDMTFDEIEAHPYASLVVNKKTNLNPECRACKFVHLCRSGCIATHDETGKTRWCQGLKDFFTFLVAKENIRDADLQYSRESAECVSGKGCDCESGQCG
ncbi:MAG: radical SAM protein [Desulfomonilaceae bacterium]|nr:radical SAM protein [Desulfomonilaceae bacterium]